jgi:predicted DCC family thiol-disulfide oxidoreductase YuxK
VTGRAARAAAPGGAAAAWTLIYDGDCAFCGRCVALVRRWDARGRVRAVPFQDPDALSGLPAIPRAALESAMHLVSPTGEVSAGAAALPVILRLLPLGTPVASLFRIPGVPVLASRVYETVARNRHRLGCGSTVCRRGR